MPRLAVEVRDRRGLADEAFERIDQGRAQPCRAEQRLDLSGLAVDSDEVVARIKPAVLRAGQRRRGLAAVTFARQQREARIVSHGCAMDGAPGRVVHHGVDQRDRRAAANPGRRLALRHPGDAARCRKVEREQHGNDGGLPHRIDAVLDQEARLLGSVRHQRGEIVVVSGDEAEVEIDVAERALDVGGQECAGQFLRGESEARGERAAAGVRFDRRCPGEDLRDLPPDEPASFHEARAAASLPRRHRARDPSATAPADCRSAGIPGRRMRPRAPAPKSPWRSQRAHRRRPRR